MRRQRWEEATSWKPSKALIGASSADKSSQRQSRHADIVRPVMQKSDRLSHAGHNCRVVEERGNKYEAMPDGSMKSEALAQVERHTDRIESVSYTHLRAHETGR